VGGVAVQVRPESLTDHSALPGGTVAVNNIERFQTMLTANVVVSFDEISFSCDPGLAVHV
jgi:hypothetical protein